PVGGNAAGIGVRFDEVEPAAQRKLEELFATPMEPLGDLTLSGKELSVKTFGEGRQLAVHFEGTADMRQLALLSDLFKRLHAKALDRKAAAVTVDFQALEFLDSSCIKAILSWITAVRDTADKRRYRLHVRCSHTKRWQVRSIETLVTFAPELMTVE